MRVTTSMLFRDALTDLSRLRNRMARTQEQLASGNNINRPSDDPAGAGRIHQFEAALRGLEQHERTISATRARVGEIENALANTGDIMVRARELAVQGANGTLDATARAQLAREVEGLHASLLAEANTRFSDGHVFAGFASDSPPFVAAGSFGAPPAAPVVSFAGDSNEIEVDVEEGVRIAVSLDGRRVFLGDADGDGLLDAGREDAFQLLVDLRNALAQDDQSGVGSTLGRIDAAREQFQSERTRAGSLESRLEAARQRVAARAEHLEINLSNLQDISLEEVVTDLVRQETALSASLQMMSRLLPPSLMDFLR